MNTTQEEIENVLRAAPKPAPPPGLKEQLNAQVRLPVTQPGSQAPPMPLAPAAWLRRWWPVLLPASVSLACAVGLTVQQVQIGDLKQAIQDLSRNANTKPSASPTPPAQTNDVPSQTDATAMTQQEVARLKALAGQLSAEVAQLEQMSAENRKLRAELAEPPPGFFTPEEAEALAKAKEKAESINCINNLKQMGLAVRIWAIDHGDMNPPDILSMTNELNIPTILVCLADHARGAARDWASYTSANCSYEYLAPSAPDNEPSRVLFRCPIHGHVCLCDGSVQSDIGKKHPDWLVQRDGKLYLQPPAQPLTDPTRPASPQPENSNP